MSPYDFPPEYGAEHGERCGRNRCRGRMVTDRPPCSCWEDELAETEDERALETFTCTCGLIVICNICGESPDFE